MSIVRILNDFFDAIYVVTLKRAEERHAFIQEELDGLNYKTHWGVDGKKLNYEDLIAKGLYDSGKAKELRHDGNDLALTEIGCALSHREVYSEMLANGYKKILVLEDDVFIDESSLKVLKPALHELPDDWELLYLGYRGNGSLKGSRLQVYSRMLIYPFFYLLGMKKYNPVELRRRYTRRYSAHLELSGYHYGTHAYGLTAQGAKKLLNYQTPVTQAADHALATLCINNKINSLNVKAKVLFQNREVLQSLIGNRV